MENCCGFEWNTILNENMYNLQGTEILWWSYSDWTTCWKNTLDIVWSLNMEMFNTACPQSSGASLVLTPSVEMTLQMLLCLICYACPPVPLKQ